MPGDVAEPVGVAAAEMLRHLMAVLDREDRLESGTGNWLTGFADDADAQRDAMHLGVLRCLRMGLEENGYRILRDLSGSTGRSIDDVARNVGMSALSVAERISDLVSAGLASKLPEANQVAVTRAGEALVDLVRRATEAGLVRLGERR